MEKSFDKETDSTADRPFRWGKTKRKWAKVRSPRQALLRLGKDMRPLIDRTIARHSEVGDPAVFDPDVFPHARELEANWETIRDEADRVLVESGGHGVHLDLGHETRAILAAGQLTDLVGGHEYTR